MDYKVYTIQTAPTLGLHLPPLLLAHDTPATTAFLLFPEHAFHLRTLHLIFPLPGSLLPVVSLVSLPHLLQIFAQISPSQ